MCVSVYVREYTPSLSLPRYIMYLAAVEKNPDFFHGCEIILGQESPAMRLSPRDKASYVIEHTWLDSSSLLQPPGGVVTRQRIGSDTG